MLIDMKNLVSITEANRNFSKWQSSDENGSVVILKNNAPRYVLVSFEQIMAAEQSGMMICWKSLGVHSTSMRRRIKNSQDEAISVGQVLLIHSISLNFGRDGRHP
jgi:antitoxin Phd